MLCRCVYVFCACTPIYDLYVPTQFQVLHLHHKLGDTGLGAYTMYTRAKQVQQHNLRAGCASGATACTLRGISSVGSPSPWMQDRHFLHGGHVLALAFRSHCQRRNWWRSITTFKINLKRACTVSCLNITCFAICWKNIDPPFFISKNT